MGKASFCHIQDKQGYDPGLMYSATLLLVKINHTRISRSHDVGDIVGIKGYSYLRTKTGEIVS